MCRKCCTCIFCIRWGKKVRYFQKYLNFFFLLTAILQSMLCFYGQVQFSTGWPRNPLSTYMNMLFYFACKFLFAEPTVLLALTNRLVTKIFTAFIGWNGMRLRMKEKSGRRRSVSARSICVHTFLILVDPNYIAYYIVNFYKKCKPTVSCTHWTFWTSTQRTRQLCSL